jgi:hypothetical protein
MSSTRLEPPCSRELARLVLDRTIALCAVDEQEW